MLTQRGTQINAVGEEVDTNTGYGSKDSTYTGRLLSSPAQFSGFPSPEILVLTLDSDAQSVTTFERVGLPVETEPIHLFPIPTKEIAFDEPPTETLYPTTEPPSDFFDNLSLNVSDYKGDIVSTPIVLEGDRPLIGDVSQKPLSFLDGDLTLKDLLPTGVTATGEKKKFNYWLLIIAALVVLGVYYLSKNK